MPRSRRAGSRWRLLVHELLPGRGSGASWTVSDEPAPVPAIPPVVDDPARHHQHLPGTEFDEIAVGSWLHVEQMDLGKWWMNVGGVVLWVRVDKRGRPQQVDVYGPGDYDDPVEGVAYGGPALAAEWPPAKEPEVTDATD